MASCTEVGHRGRREVASLFELIAAIVVVESVGDWSTSPNHRDSAGEIYKNVFWVSQV